MRMHFVVVSESAQLCIGYLYVYCVSTSNGTENYATYNMLLELASHACIAFYIWNDYKDTHLQTTNGKILDVDNFRPPIQQFSLFANFYDVVGLFRRHFGRRDLTAGW